MDLVQNISIKSSPEDTSFLVQKEAMSTTKARSNRCYRYFSRGKRVPKDVKRYCGICRQHGILMETRGHQCEYKECGCNKCLLIKSRRQIMSEQIRIRRAQDRLFQRTTDPCEADVIPVLDVSSDTIHANSSVSLFSPDQIQEATANQLQKAFSKSEFLLPSSVITLTQNGGATEATFNNSPSINNSFQSLCYFCQKCKNHKELVWKKNHKRFCKYKECRCELCDLIETRRQLDQSMKTKHAPSNKTIKLATKTHDIEREYSVIKRNTNFQLLQRVPQNNKLQESCSSFDESLGKSESYTDRFVRQIIHPQNQQGQLNQSNIDINLILQKLINPSASSVQSKNLFYAPTTLSSNMPEINAILNALIANNNNTGFALNAQILNRNFNDGCSSTHSSLHSPSLSTNTLLTSLQQKIQETIRGNEIQRPSNIIPNNMISIQMSTMEPVLASSHIGLYPSKNSDFSGTQSNLFYNDQIKCLSSRQMPKLHEQQRIISATDTPLDNVAMSILLDKLLSMQQQQHSK